MFEAFFVAALLTAIDPVGDAVGDGSLDPPSAAVYRNLAPFDLRQVTVTDDRQLTLAIEMGSLSDPFNLPLGFSLPVIEVYLSGTEGGRNELLPGSGMRLPPEQGWEVAVRLTGEQATAYRVNSGPRGVETAPVGVTVEGNQLLVTTPFPRPDRPRLYAITGLYDLFGATPWRPVDPRESPWAFSSASQRVPVIDVLARNDAGQARAIETGVLTSAGGRGSLPGTVWLVLMALGLFIALGGVALRVLTRPHPAPLDGVGTAADEEVPDVAGPAPAASAAERGEAAETGASAGSPETPLRPFTWDSSALLTEPDDEDELAEEFESEFGNRNAGQSPGKYTSDAWQRPVPLPLRPTAPNESGASADDDEEPEVLRDHSEDESTAEEELAGAAAAAGDDREEATIEESAPDEVSESAADEAEERPEGSATAPTGEDGSDDEAAREEIADEHSDTGSTPEPATGATEPEDPDDEDSDFDADDERRS